MPTRSMGADQDYKGLFAILAAKFDPRNGTPSGLGTGDKGRAWYDLLTNKFMWWNGTAAVDATDLSNSSGNLTNSRISDFMAGVYAARLDQLTAPTNPVPLNGQKITGLADGSANTDAVTYGQLIALINNRGFKDPVRAVVTSNVNLTGGAPNAFDGVNFAQFDRVLVIGQTTASQNGIYSVATLGTGANGTWTRSTDADNSAELPPGAVVQVQEGTLNADKLYMLLTNGPIVLGTTALSWGAYGASSGEIGVGGAGLVKTGVTYDVTAGPSGTIIVGADTVDVNVARICVKRVGTIPTATGTVDGITVTISGAQVTWTHGQNNPCPKVTIRAGSSPVAGYTAGEVVDMQDTTVDNNNVRATLPQAPAANNWVFMVEA